MSSNVDVRVQRTQEQIREAFMGLLVERPFAKITVSAVTERARINRATFYRHYTDIADLAARLTDLLFADTIATLEGQGTQADLRPLFTHVAEHAPFYRAMMGPDGIPGFRERVEAAVAAQITAWLPPTPGRERVPAAVAVRYLAAAQVGFIQWWLENEMPLAPGTAAQHLLDLHVHGGWWGLGLDETAVSRGD
ncbi:MAG: TetR/AcrR family transcriptional regulator C-terminal domain-containing protein [Anaerolineales bacterium]|nr:TetR/AcrR family transcriptional regulator C-terminal domain-containing protein [Anaerolineales bacterium]